jgi:hypothetical protein
MLTAALAARSGHADQVVLEPLKDNTLIEHPEGIFSNGSGPRIFAGRINEAELSIRRAVLAFDLAGSVPAGSDVTEATLTLTAQSPPLSGPASVTISVHRLLADWGEGSSSSNGGLGAFPGEGDAT